MNNYSGAIILTHPEKRMMMTKTSGCLVVALFMVIIMMMRSRRARLSYGEPNPVSCPARLFACINSPCNGLPDQKRPPLETTILVSHLRLYLPLSTLCKENIAVLKIDALDIIQEASFKSIIFILGPQWPLILRYSNPPARPYIYATKIPSSVQSFPPPLSLATQPLPLKDMVDFPIFMSRT